MVAVVAELNVYGFRCRKGRFPEIMKFLENRSVTESVAAPIVAVGRAYGLGIGWDRGGKTATTEPAASDAAGSEQGGERFSDF